MLDNLSGRLGTKPIKPALLWGIPLGTPPAEQTRTHGMATLPCRVEKTMQTKMKLKHAILSLVALTAACTVASAQTNAPAADTNQPPAAPAASTPAPVTQADATAATAVGNLAQAAPAATAAPAPAAQPAAADSSASHDPSAVIPLIVMDEVPLTDAIKNLARQAGINYMLDPKINYGTPDANGVVHQQPSVSLRWENLTADQALNAVLNNYNLVMVDDPKTHIARITIKDPAAPDPLVTKIVQLKFSDVTNMSANVETVLQDKRSKVVPDARTSQLVIVATEQEILAADQLIARLDTPTKEVLIEAKLVELQKNPTTSKGIDWSGTLAAQHFTFGNGTTTGNYLSSAGNTTAVNGGTGSLPVGSVNPPFIAPNPTTLSTTVTSPN